MSKGRWTSRKIRLMVHAVQDLGLTVVGVEVTETGGVKVITAPGPESVPSEQGMGPPPIRGGPFDPLGHVPR